MATKTKAALKTQSNSTFPDNTAGLITPANHRAFNDDFLDSVLMAVDLGSTSEQLTGWLYNGKDVYIKMVDFTSNLGTDQSNLISLSAGQVLVCVDFNLSYVKDTGGKRFALKDWILSTSSSAQAGFVTEMTDSSIRVYNKCAYPTQPFSVLRVVYYYTKP